MIDPPSLVDQYCPGARAATVLAEIPELAPFGKILFSSGARLFREALGRVLGAWVTEGAWSPEDARRVAGLVASGNTNRVYGLG